MTLMWGLGLFAAAVAIHLVIWRTFRPVHQYATLLGIFLAVLAGVSLAMLAAPVGEAASWRLTGLLDYVTFAMLYIALALAYTSTFSAVQADSPSMLLLLLIHDAGRRGIEVEKLHASLGDDVLIMPRLEDLLTGGLALQKEGRYVIEPRGALMAGIHVSYRSLLKMGKGG